MNSCYKNTDSYGFSPFTTSDLLNLYKIKLLKKLTVLFSILFIAACSWGQGVGLVLSGGGASGLAHIGVIKALEENNIPIHYISGTSAGALVGALYSCGYSPEEMEEYVTSETFQLMTMGNLKQEQEFLLREDNPNAGVINFSVSFDSILKKSLPTNFIRPELLDYEMLRIMGVTSARCGDNFDSLFVPYRCVASDIEHKKPVTFQSGHLNEAVRASMTFPFYVNPIRIDGVLYFDGGLYNNFPANVMYESFNPDYMLGSNVSGNAQPPNEDDLIGQLTTMLMSPTNFDIPCEQGIIIQAQGDVNTFDFEKVDQAIATGYSFAMQMMDSIKQLIPYRITTEQLELKRQAFRKKTLPLSISNVHTLNQLGQDESYVRKSILKNNKKKTISWKTFERRYFRTYSTPQIDYLFPTLHSNKDSSFTIELNVKPAKDLTVEMGGIISSRAINTGFVQLKYMRLDRFASSIGANSYFGKFYGSGKAFVDINLPSYYPVDFKGYITLNRFDYFRSFATFFEDVQPSFLVQYETFAGGQFKLPIFNNSTSTLDYKRFELEDQYYQNNNFTNKDTVDLTRFYGDVFSFQIEQNSLNHKQFANKGHLLSISARLVQGREHSISGSSSIEEYDYRKYHQWFTLTGEAQTYPIKTKNFSIGLYGMAHLSSMPLFKNYTATILQMSAFQPIPDMATYFLPEYRSNQFIGAGTNIVFIFRKNIDIRFDGYLFQPFNQLVKNDNGSFGYSELFKGESFLTSSSFIYHSPIGPIRATVNYFPLQQNPLQLQLSYGFVIFNERATRQ